MASPKTRPVDTSELFRCGLCALRCTRCGKARLQGPVVGVSSFAVDGMLCMARPTRKNLAEYGVIEQLRREGYRGVLNLQQAGEHPSCGGKLLSSGFTYEPEAVMAAGLLFFNFAWAENTLPDMDTMFSVCKTVVGILEDGHKVALHAHGYGGRASLAAACCLVFRTGMKPAEAVVRMRRAAPKALSKPSIGFLRAFAAAAADAKAVFSALPSPMAAALTRQRKALVVSSSTRDLYHVPRVVHAVCHALNAVDPDRAVDGILGVDWSTSLETQLRRLKSAVNDGQWGALNAAATALQAQLLLDWLEHSTTPLVEHSAVMATLGAAVAAGSTPRRLDVATHRIRSVATAHSLRTMPVLGSSSSPASGRLPTPGSDDDNPAEALRLSPSRTPLTPSHTQSPPVLHVVPANMTTASANALMALVGLLAALRSKVPEEASRAACARVCVAVLHLPKPHADDDCVDAAGTVAGRRFTASCTGTWADSRLVALTPASGTPRAAQASTTRLLAWFELVVDGQAEGGAPDAAPNAAASPVGTPPPLAAGATPPLTRQQVVDIVTALPEDERWAVAAALQPRPDTQESDLESSLDGGVVVPSGPRRIRGLTPRGGDGAGHYSRVSSASLKSLVMESSPKPRRRLMPHTSASSLADSSPGMSPQIVRHQTPAAALTDLLDSLGCPPAALGAAAAASHPRLRLRVQPVAGGVPRTPPLRSATQTMASLSALLAGMATHGRHLRVSTAAPGSVRHRALPAIPDNRPVTTDTTASARSLRGISVGFGALPSLPAHTPVPPAERPPLRRPRVGMGSPRTGRLARKHRETVGGRPPTASGPEAVPSPGLEAFDSMSSPLETPAEQSADDGTFMGFAERV